MHPLQNIKQNISQDLNMVKLSAISKAPEGMEVWTNKNYSEEIEILKEAFSRLTLRELEALHFFTAKLEG